MKQRAGIVILIALVSAVPSIGIAGGEGARARAPEPCVHPYPCGDEWPAGLEGPFELREVRRVQVRSHDGVLLDGWLSFPELPPGVRAPVLLHVSPYLENCQDNGVCWRPPTSPNWWDENDLQYDTWDVGLGIHPIQWIRRGYVHALFSVRGTGGSGGCFEFGGSNEQLDQALLVDWLAGQEWSNGRVGIGGLSYGGWTAWQAAVQAPHALKAILSVSPVIDYYWLVFSPQGVGITWRALLSLIFQENSTRPGALLLPDPVLPSFERAVCAETLEETHETALSVGLNLRTESLYEERNLAPRLDQVTAAVLHAQGYADVGHSWQDRTFAASLPRRTPVRELRHWLGHAYPTGAPAGNLGGSPGPAPTLPFDPPGPDSSWEDTVTGWFDYWLKGVGAMPRLQVDALDQTGTWHEGGDRWPPRRARDEVLYPAAGALTGRPGGEGSTFRAAHNPENALTSWAAQGDYYGGGVEGLPGTVHGASLCGDPAAEGPLSAPYVTGPVESDVVISGNPYLQAKLTSDGPSGAVAAALWDLPPGFSCVGGAPSGAAPTLIGPPGHADLEHYAARYTATPFPVGTPTDLRIDIADVTYRLRAGHRLALVVSRPEWPWGGTVAAAPEIHVHADGGRSATRLVIPVVEGTLRGADGSR